MQILHYLHRLEHLWLSVSVDIPETNPPWMPKDNSTIIKYHERGEHRLTSRVSNPLLRCKDDSDNLKMLKVHNYLIIFISIFFPP